MLKKNNFLSWTKEFFVLAILLITAFIISLDKTMAKTSFDGICLWATCVLPSLFPYLVITGILSNLRITGTISRFLSPITKKIFNVNGACGYAFIMSLISGYPVGAKIVSDLRKSDLISESESVRAAVLCSSPSPVFTLSVVGNAAFNNPLFGTLLFISVTVAIIIVGALFSFYKRKDKPKVDLPVTVTANDDVFSESVFSSIISSLTVGGMITVFYIFTEILSVYNVLYPVTAPLTKLFKNETTAKGIIFGLFECTKGIKTLSAIKSFSMLPWAAFICGFGGICVIAQSTVFLKKAKIKIAPFVLGKAATAILSFIIAVILSFLFCR